jgi:hypothetical protein
MKWMWIGGNHPRHLSAIERIAREFPLAGAIVERREGLLPEPPPGLPEIDHLNFIRHFHGRQEAEARYFGNPGMPETLRREVNPSELNTSATAAFVRSVSPDIVLIFGCGMVREPLYSALPGETINLHLGLSPRYRGAATLFWPFYFLEPAYAGATFHYIVGEPDAGDIIHQVVPSLSPEDGIHDVACKTVQGSAEEAVLLFRQWEAGPGWHRFPQSGTGKKFLSSDFRPAHLRVIYTLFEDAIVRRYLEGSLPARTPKLVRQF